MSTHDEQDDGPGAPGASGAIPLWYRHPARAWTEALPIGNGTLGAMVFGRVERELIQLNEDSIWAGGPMDRNNPDARRHLTEVRSLLWEGNPVEAIEMADYAMMGIPQRLRPYQPLGDLTLRFLGHRGEPSDYRRELDLAEAVARMTYRLGEATFTREVFASAPDQVLAVRLACDRPGMISLAAGLYRKFDTVVRAEAPDKLALRGRGGSDGVTFWAVLTALPEGGRVRTVADCVLVEGADAVTLLLAAATDYRWPDPEETCRDRLADAAAKPYARLRAAHVAEHRAWFDRVALTPFPPPPRPTCPPTSASGASPTAPMIPSLSPSTSSLDGT